MDGSIKLSYEIAYKNMQKFGDALFEPGWENNPALLNLAQTFTINNAAQIYNNGWNTKFDANDSNIYNKAASTHPLVPNPGGQSYKTVITIQGINAPNTSDNSKFNSQVTFVQQDNMNETLMAGHLEQTDLSFAMNLGFTEDKIGDQEQYMLSSYSNAPTSGQ